MAILEESTIGKGTKNLFPRQSLKRFPFCVKLSDSIFCFRSFSYRKINLT